MSFRLHEFGIAASIFLALFVIYTAIAIYAVYIKGFKSLYSALCLYGFIRLGGQISGIGFATLGFRHYQWLVAYIVLTAEGYFTIVLASMFLLCREQRKAWGKSPLETPFKASGFYKDISFLFLAYFILIVANVLLVVGGSMTSGMTLEDLVSNNDRVIASRALRVTGQSIFLVLSLMILGCAIYNYMYQRLRTIAMKALIFITPFITVRGIFGVLAAVVEKMNYMALWNYFDPRKHAELTMYEYVLSTTMEFVAAFTLLNLIWLEIRSGNDDKSNNEVYHNVIGEPSKEDDYGEK